MHGYFDESGSATVVKGALFVIVGVWVKNPHPVEKFMRKWLRKLRSDGYRLMEIKGAGLSPVQRSSGLLQISEKLKAEIDVDIAILPMSSLIKDYRLFYPRKWTETEIHQSILYQMLTEQIKKQGKPYAKVAIDRRHTLPKTFFNGIQNLLRTNFSSNAISVFPGLSHEQKGIQLADVLCNSRYSAVRSAFYRGDQLEEMPIREQVQLPVNLKIYKSTELVDCLNRFKQAGGPL